MGYFPLTVEDSRQRSDKAASRNRMWARGIPALRHAQCSALSYDLDLISLGWTSGFHFERGRGRHQVAYCSQGEVFPRRASSNAAERGECQKAKTELR